MPKSETGEFLENILGKEYCKQILDVLFQYGKLLKDSKLKHLHPLCKSELKSICDSIVLQAMAKNLEQDPETLMIIKENEQEQINQIVKLFEKAIEEGYGSKNYGKDSP